MSDHIRFPFGVTRRELDTFVMCKIGHLHSGTCWKNKEEKITADRVKCWIIPYLNIMLKRMTKNEDYESCAIIKNKIKEVNEASTFFIHGWKDHKYGIVSIDEAWGGHTPKKQFKHKNYHKCNTL